ncbi:hypothetical protein DM860_014927 [Cuscuta australis]|uniref:Uncharacterized protein n=1 Tax=Cuscuta australis TaxID=267555 RepID=A0A328E3I0_9ASTE|nr:hypothetical protein DM860_014927 [Cuscuta australis]
MELDLQPVPLLFVPRQPQPRNSPEVAIASSPEVVAGLEGAGLQFLVSASGVDVDNRRLCRSRAGTV